MDKMSEMTDDELLFEVCKHKYNWPAGAVYAQYDWHGYNDFVRDPAAALELLEDAGFTVGPEWTGGFDYECKRCGWSVYADWMSAAEDTWAMDSQKRALAAAPTFARAVAEAWLAWKRGEK